MAFSYSELIDHFSVHYNLAYEEFVNARNNTGVCDSYYTEQGHKRIMA